LRSTEDAHGATFDFGRGQHPGLGWSDPTFGGFQPPKDFVGSLQPSTLVARSRRDVVSLQAKPNGSALGSEAIEGVADARALLTVEEVAELLRVPLSWVYERTRKRSMDRIPGFRLGKYWRFREADVLAWLDRQRSGPW
jgi:excisionase family DNA binding protein